MTIYYDMCNEDYHSHEGVSSTKLRCLLRDVPSTARVKMMDKSEKKAYVIGNLFHTIILEPNTFEERYIVKPDSMSFATKDGKAWQSEALKTGKVIITQQESDWVNGLKDHIALHADYEPIRKMTDGGRPEVSYIWDQEIHIHYPERYFIEKIKARPDWVWEKKGVLFDLKTTSKKASDFNRSIQDYDYLLQAYMQIIAYESHYEQPCKMFIWVVVEAFPPFNVTYFHLDLEDRQGGYFALGKHLFEVAIGKWRTCKSTNNWPGYGPNLKPLDLQPYYINNSWSLTHEQ